MFCAIAIVLFLVEPWLSRGSLGGNRSPEPVHMFRLIRRFFTGVTTTVRINVRTTPAVAKQSCSAPLDCGFLLDGRG